MQHLPLWYFSVFLYFIFSTIFGLQQRRLSQKSRVPLGLLPSLALTVVLYPVAVAVALLSGNLWIHLTWQAIVLLLVESILIGGMNVAQFRLNKHIDATQFVIIKNTYTFATVGLGVFILHEAFSGRQFVGLVLLLMGAVLVAVKGFPARTFKIDKYSWLLMGAALLFGVGLVAEKAALSYMSLYMYLIVGWGAQFAVGMLFVHKDWKVIPQITKKEWGDIIKVGISRGGVAFTYISAIHLARNVALVSTITSFTIPCMFIASYFILNERDHLARKIIGVIIATVGLILL